MAKYEVYVSPSRSSTGLYFWISPLEQAYRAKVISLSKFKISSLIFFLPSQLAARRCFAAVWLAARLILPPQLAARRFFAAVCGSPPGSFCRRLYIAACMALF